MHTLVLSHTILKIPTTSFFERIWNEMWSSIQIHKPKTTKLKKSMDLGKKRIKILCNYIFLYESINISRKIEMSIVLVISLRIYFFCHFFFLLKENVFLFLYIFLEILSYIYCTWMRINFFVKSFLILFSFSLQCSFI